MLAALGIQQALRTRREGLGEGGSGLAVRIGINTGPVVVGTIGDSLRLDYTAIGDTTNLAARLQQHAEPGAILISEATYRLLYQRTEVGEQIYVFKHALTQDVAHDSLLTSTRQSLHEGTAQALEAIYQDRLEDHYEKLAHHYAHTANHEKALEYLELANRKATTSNAMQEAATYFEKAIALLDIMPDTESNRHRRIRLIVNQWIVFWLLLRIPDYYDLLVRHQVMAVALGNSELLATFYLHLGHCQWVFGLLHESADTLTDAVRFNEAAGVSEKSGPAYSMLQWCNHYLGNYDEALSWREAAMQRLRQPFDLRWTVWSLGSASWTYSCLGRGREAIEEARKEVALAEEYGDDSLVAVAHWILSLAPTYNGDFAKAIGHAEVAVEKAPTLADRVWAQTHLGFARCRGGRAREGAELLAPLIPMYEATRFVLGQVFAGTYLGEAYWRAGQLDDAERSLQEALELATRAGMRFYVGSIHRLLGEIAVSRDPHRQNRLRRRTSRRAFGSSRDQGRERAGARLRRLRPTAHEPGSRWASRWAFQPRIDVFERWSLPMALAWAMWGTPDAVRDQWDDYRRGCDKDRKGVWEWLPGEGALCIGFECKQRPPASLLSLNVAALGAHPRQILEDALAALVNAGANDRLRATAIDAIGREVMLTASMWNRLTFRDADKPTRIVASGPGVPTLEQIRDSHGGPSGRV